MAPLAPYRRQVSIFVSGLVATLLVLVLAFVDLYSVNPWYFWLFIVLTGVSVYWFKTAHQKKNIFFDKGFMYLIGPKGNTEPIPFRDVQKLSLMNSKIKILGMHYHEYKIKGISKNSNIKAFKQIKTGVYWGK